MKNKLTKIICKHLFNLSEIRMEAIGGGQTNSSANPFYQKVAYVVCEKCGEVKKQFI